MNFSVALPHIWDHCPLANFSETDQPLFDESFLNRELIPKRMKENLLGT